MADNDNKDPQGQSSENNQDPQNNGQQGGQSSQQPIEQGSNQPIEDLPEKFKGKSASDIAKSYVELEKKLGEHSKLTKDQKEELERWSSLGKIIEQNPALYKQIEAEIIRLSNQGASDQNNNQNNKPPEKDDTRTATENILINKFEETFGINLLPQEKRIEMHQKIGQELAEMLDPGGKKPVKDVIQEISLDKLPRYLEKAYRLATINDREEQARVQALLEDRQNREGSFGSIPSSGVRSNKVELTEKEREVARKMGISEEDYLKEKIELSKQ